jgi:hypothetical protein
MAQTQIFQGHMNEGRLRAVRIHGDRAEYEVIARRGGLAIKENVVVLGVMKPEVGVFVKGAIFVPDGI